MQTRWTEKTRQIMRGSQQIKSKEMQNTMGEERAYSVLMSVYHKEKAEYLQQSMDSIFSQTVPTDDFVLVCDGVLNSALDLVIEKMQEKFGDRLNVIRLEKNGGLGNALNIGIKHCSNELVARMDSDDIAYPDRCERQLQVFRKMKNVAVCSGIVEEFSDTPERTETRRVPPETQEEILLFAKRRNPFNHPCVMYKKSVVEAVGGYQEFYLLEDYYLWLRMLMNGYEGYNIQEPLLHMRAGKSMYLRRSGWEYAKSQKALFQYMKEQKFISTNEYIQSVLLRGLSSLSPNWLRKMMFETLLRT